MPFKRYVEIGRVAMVNFGEDYGKLVVISDVVDQNRALVDSPTEVRKVVSFKRLTLTTQKIDIPRLAKKSVIKAKFEESEVLAKFEGSAWGKKLASRATKASMGDFDRFKVAVAKSKANRALRAAVNKLA